MKENLPAHHYPQRARNLGPRQLPPDKAQEAPRPPAATVMPDEPEKPASGPRGKPRKAP
jgi:hypothetical protein